MNLHFCTLLLANFDCSQWIYFISAKFPRKGCSFQYLFFASNSSRQQKSSMGNIVPGNKCSIHGTFALRTFHFLCGLSLPGMKAWEAKSTRIISIPVFYKKSAVVTNLKKRNTLFRTAVCLTQERHRQPGTPLSMAAFPLINTQSLDVCMIILIHVVRAFQLDSPAGVDFCNCICMCTV